MIIWVLMAAMLLLLLVMSVIFVTHLRRTRKQMDMMMSKISNLYMRQTQAASVRHETEQSRSIREENSEGLPPIYHHPGLPRSIAPTFDDSPVPPQPVQTEPQAASQPSFPQAARQSDSPFRPASQPVAQQTQPAVTSPAQTADVTEEPLFQVKSRGAESDDELIASLKALIDKNLSNPDLSVNDLAAELCVSRSGLFAKVKEATGETPNKMINDARLEKATKLLEEGKKPINEICYLVGYSSPSYFTRCFSKQYGMTPHEWMRNKGQQ